MTRTLLVVLALQFALFAGCSTPEDEAKSLVERAWKARVAGDRDAFASVVVGEDVPHIEVSGAVLNLKGVSKPARQALVKSLQVEAKETRAESERVEVDTEIVWFPPGASSRATEQHTYVAVKTPDGWRLDMELDKRAKIAKAIGEARTAIRAGNPELASKLLAEISDEDLKIPESAMIAGAVEATEESVKSADILAELRAVMEAHHEAEDPATRANLVKKARDLGIEDYQLPPDVQTLWDDAKKLNEQAEKTNEVAELVVIEAKGARVGHGAEVLLEMKNQNDQPVSGLSFVIDLLDEGGVRLHRLSHDWAGPLEPGATAQTTVSAPSVPPQWSGAVNVRLEAARPATP